MAERELCVCVCVCARSSITRKQQRAAQDNSPNTQPAPNRKPVLTGHAANL
ncbi:Uncharacterized protein APZ42_011020 [Daphnia magna]|uniref:Uncharacterized protein n=1 Tax=Daphnia magna TaxID=35525 RepID=A0A162T456_9CRUS|nr:Uncharacterized protein APZ42_011020 [Daphnia magna]